MVIIGLIYGLAWVGVFFVSWCIYRAINPPPVAKPKNVVYTDKSWQL